MQRHRTRAAVLSTIFMGLGQIYNRQFIKGIMFLVVEAAAVYYFIQNLATALWGFVTLGENPSRLVKVKGIAKMVAGDHSIYILIQSLITILMLIIIILAWYLNIKDAYKTGEKRDNGLQANTFKQSVRYILDYKFAQTFLVLPGIGVLFFTIMPIIFMILLAFTNYSAPDHLPPAKLVDWVGFQTFRNLLVLKTWSHTFYGVLTWTIIWAVLQRLLHISEDYW